MLVLGILIGYLIGGMLTTAVFLYAVTRKDG